MFRMKFACLVLLLGSLSSVLARDAKREESTQNQKMTASRIAHVTVYQSNALVTREVDVPAGVGPIELVVSPLPPQTVQSSLYSEGSDSIRILTTRYRTRAIKEDTREEVRDLENQLKDLSKTAQNIQGEMKALDANLQMLSKMEGFTNVTTVSATEKGQLNSEASISLVKFVMEQRKEKSKELVTLQQQQQANQEQAEFAKRKLQELAAGSNRTERDAVIVVDKRDPAAGKIRLNYLVDSAFWRPQYKLRTGPKDKDVVLLEYLAAIVQQSGEDWNNVGVVLSTAQPMLNAAPPELKTLELTVIQRSAVPVAQSGGGGMPGQPAPGGLGGGRVGGQSPEELGKQLKSLRGRAQAEYNRNKEGDGTSLYNEAAALEQERELLAIREDHHFGPKGKPGRSDEEGPTVTYHLQGKFSVPSRNDEQVLEVAKLDMSPEYYFKAVPVLTPHVYRQATMTNKSEYVLLPGEATMYRGSDFVGRMNVPLVAIGEQFTVGFGVDPQLQAHRQLMDKTRTMQGGNQVLKYEYRILVSSYKAEPVKLQVWDRLPRAENETAGVSLIKAMPELSGDQLYLREQRPSNLLRWDVTVAPGTNGEKAMAIKYEFRLELDKQLLISSLLSK